MDKRTFLQIVSLLIIAAVIFYIVCPKYYFKEAEYYIQSDNLKSGFLHASKLVGGPILSEGLLRCNRITGSCMLICDLFTEEVQEEEEEQES